jgi:hypothetical protein
MLTFFIIAFLFYTFRYFLQTLCHLENSDQQKVLVTVVNSLTVNVYMGKQLSADVRVERFLLVTHLTSFVFYVCI